MGILTGGIRIGRIALFPPGVLPLLWTLVESVLASLAGAALYREGVAA